jgi:hypothetical protein
LQLKQRHTQTPPDDARIIFFHGGKKPWDFKASVEEEKIRCPQCRAVVKIQSSRWNRPWRGSRGDYRWIAQNYQ